MHPDDWESHHNDSLFFCHLLFVILLFVIYHLSRTDDQWTFDQSKLRSNLI